MMIDQRVRRYAEQILDNESLADELDDKQAQTLIQWGLSISERLVRKTEHMDDEQADEVLYPSMKALRRLLRMVNQTVGQPASMTPDEIAENVDKILGYAADIPAVSATTPDNIDQFARLIRMVQPRDGLSRILALVQVEGQSEEEMPTDASSQSEPGINDDNAPTPL